METNTSIADGFFLALYLLESLGVEFDRLALLARLREVASGEVSALNSPEEELEAEVQRRGTPATPEERKEYRRLFTNRQDMDLGNRLHAEHVVRVILRELNGQWPVS